MKVTEYLDAWYEKYHRKNEITEFVVWWVCFYGPPEDHCLNSDELHEYWVRRAMALQGFLAGKNTVKETK